MARITPCGTCGGSGVIYVNTTKTTYEMVPVVKQRQVKRKNQYGEWETFTEDYQTTEKKQIAVQVVEEKKCTGPGPH